MKLFDGKDQIPIFAPYDVAVVNGELFEFLFIEILVILGVRICFIKTLFCGLRRNIFLVRAVRFSHY